MKRTKKDFRPAFLIPAAIFLANPNINLLDIFPDCIGYLFLIAAIYPTTELVPHFFEAKRGFSRLFWITLLKIPAYLAVTSVIGDNMDNRVMITLATLAFSLLETVFAFSAFSELFEGMDYLGGRFGAFSASGRVATDARHATYAWVAAKGVLAFLPELCHLSSYDYSGVVSGATRDIADYYIFFLITAAVIGLVFGIVYLVYMASFSSVLSHDEALLPLLAEIREETVQPLRGAARIRRVKTALSLYAAGAFAMMNIYLDNINYLPTALASVFFALAALFLLPLSRRARAPLALSLLSLPITVAAYIARESFFAEYSYGALGRIVAADRLYDLTSILFTVESVLLTATLLLFAYLFFYLVRQETGYRSDNIHNYSDHLSLHAALSRKATTLTVLGVLATAANTADFYLRRITDSFAKGNPGGGTAEEVVLPVFGAFWIVALLTAFMFFLYAMHYAAVMTDEVSLKYSLD